MAATIKVSLWNGNSPMHDTVDALNKLLPSSGEVASSKGKNKALEKFRKAQNAYYDLYNNGLFNKARSFSSVFGIKASVYKLDHGVFCDHFYDLVEAEMLLIVKEAAKEQNI